MYVTLYKTYMNVILGYSAPILHTPLPRVKFRVKFSLGFFRSGIRSAGTLQISMISRISPQAPYHTPPRPIPRILLQEGGDWAPLAVALGSGLGWRLAIQKNPWNLGKYMSLSVISKRFIVVISG